MADNPYLDSFRNRILKGEEFARLTWDKEIEYLYKNGVGLDDVLQFLYQDKPSTEEFQRWVLQKNEKQLLDVIPEENVLSIEDLKFFNENGYVILKEAIPVKDCIATQKVIWDFLEMSPEDKSSWYQSHPSQRGLMVNFYDDVILERNRASGKIKKAFEQLYNTKKIFRSIDKVSFNPPITSTYSFKGSPLHWDVSLKLPIPFRLQGLIYLSDCLANDGAFHCVPGFHNTIEDWLSQVPKDKIAREYAVEVLESVPVEGKAGDMIIWHQALPHCATPNYGDSPRLVQYLTYFDENEFVHEEWI
ncbi:MAG: phytanoyl-CoA dioxygenase family protein [Limnohabitans sp.]|nr:phytanoyl-CoA dioxygenase family protein [Limnohabitans sp.]